MEPRVGSWWRDDHQLQHFLCKMVGSGGTESGFLALTLRSVLKPIASDLRVGLIGPINTFTLQDWKHSAEYVQKIKEINPTTGQSPELFSLNFF